MMPRKRSARVVDLPNAEYPTYGQEARRRGRRRFFGLLGATIASATLLGFKGGGCMPVPRAPRDLKPVKVDAGVDSGKATKKTGALKPARPAKKP